MEKLVKQYSGHGKLIFDGDQAADVTYRIGEFQEFVSDGFGGQVPTLRDRRGQVVHTQGHPHWHPIIGVQSEPVTLVMDDGRKLKVIFRNLQGDVQATGDFF